MGISVQLVEAGPITLMGEAALERHDSIIDNDHEYTQIVEYFVPGDYRRAVHRSVHVTLKQGLDMTAAQWQLGG
jgi:hypothetical protein